MIPSLIIESLRCEAGHVFEFDVPLESDPCIRAVIAPCPTVVDESGTLCGARVVWKNPLPFRG